MGPGLCGTLLVFFVAYFSLSSLAAPRPQAVQFAASAYRGPRSPKLVFWFQHKGNHPHEYSSENDIQCDNLPEQVSRNWELMNVLFQHKDTPNPSPSSSSEGRCAILFHHRKCVDPVIVVDLSSKIQALPRRVKSFRYCRTSCEECGKIGRSGDQFTRTTTEESFDYDDISRRK